MNNLLDKIESGEITLKWKSWDFSGGRDYGDWTTYEMFKDGKLYGTLESNWRNGFSAEINGEQAFSNVDDKETKERAWEILHMALARDDKEFVAMCPVDGNVDFVEPCGYEDISREQVMSGEWRDIYNEYEGPEILGV